MNFSAFALILLAINCWIPASASNAARRISTILNSKTPRAGPEETAQNPSAVLSVKKLLPKQSVSVDPLVIAGDIELFVACVRAGLSIQQATSAVSVVAEEPTVTYWKQVNSLLALGVEPERAWVHMQAVPGLQELARLVMMSEHSGAAIASGCQRLVDTLRADATSSAIAKAERAGVFISLPLALCFLPAFIILGLVPVVISLGAQLL
ncbi:type II secretion system F family protein [Corynebacterium ammoniagenes]|uniref:type II secretion system F family protein n=1 Tax=Corynebacterium ammoniagenes TaxID=1697 RepID=UPI00145935CF|nr:type II secretion system F family protein [Corynebacterium ammoniagenes]NMF32310.1 type II secretion system F family protein [Corynebacterium ammoniagenes]